MDGPIYLDHAATTPLRREVLEAMLPILEGPPANPSSQHRFGRRAAVLLEESRESVALALGVPSGWIHFVRGGTESNNLAVLGGFQALRERKHPDARLALSTVEHSSVHEPARRLEGRGLPVTWLPISPDGDPDPGVLEELLVPEAPLLLSMMAVNNETGLELPVASVCGRVRSAGGWMHSDLVQAVGRIPLDLATLPLDLATLSGHKLGGPVGTGALVIREGATVTPLYFGGGQERRLRPGTEDLAGAAGLAVAVTLAVREQADEARRLSALGERLLVRLRETIPDLVLHSEHGPRAPHILNVGIPHVDREALHMALDLEGIATSPGSACSSGATGPGRILEALYGEAGRGRGAVRFSFGRSTTPEDLERAAATVGRVVGRIRSTRHFGQEAR